MKRSVENSWEKVIFGRVNLRKAKGTSSGEEEEQTYVYGDVRRFEG